jgi:tetratricopeptide (TPR) repeat protein
MDSNTLVNLLDSAVMDFGGDGMGDLVVEFARQLPALLRSANDVDFSIAQKGARVIAFANQPTPVPVAITALLDVGFAMTVRAKGSEAFPLVERAIDLAQGNNLNFELRRAFNVYGVLNVDAGFPARGIECYMRAIVIANEICDVVGLAAAQSNLTAALHMLGLYRECVALTEQIVTQHSHDLRCAGSVAGARGNMANSALALHQYELGAKTAESAAKLLGLPRDGNGIFARLVCETTWMKCLLGLDDREGASRRLKVVRGLADAFKTPRSELNKELSDAAYEIYEGELTIAVAKLLKLLEKSKALPTLYRDNLVLLVRAYEKAHDHTGVLIYLGKLVEFLAKSQVDNVKRALDALKVKVQTPMPGKDDVQDLIAADVSRCL